MADGDSNVEVEVELQDNSVELEVEINTESVEEGAEQLQKILGDLQASSESTSKMINKVFAGIQKALSGILADIGKMLLDAFSVKSEEELIAAMERFGKDFAYELYEVNGLLGDVEDAIIDAATPMVKELLPAIKEIVNVAKDLFEKAGDYGEKILEVIRGINLIGLDGKLIDAQVNQEGLAGIFNLKDLLTKIQELLEPIKSMDFSGLIGGISNLNTEISAFSTMLTEKFETQWRDIIMPLGKWTVEEGAPTAIETLTSAFTALSQVLSPLMDGIHSIMLKLEPVVNFIKSAVITALQELKANFEEVGNVFSEKGEKIRAIFSAIGEALSVLWQIIEPILANIGAAFGALFEYIWKDTNIHFSSIIDVIYGFIEIIAGLFQGDLSRILEGFLSIFKGGANEAIGIINKALSLVVRGINMMIDYLNRINFDIPDWVPEIGGRSFGFTFKKVQAPQIPYLAQGAVLPANKPFMAVVGDQRHGTNIEAPLATIQEAVAAVMGNQINTLTAGFSALLQEQRAIRATIENIDLGDRTIGEAAARHNRNMAMVYGGMLL